ncbi:MAG: hypothetical protein J0M04_06140 [Verrucomicrobia bacterium]|nr:hypothetical protein [Verrucomicrobiota bacterium]
MITKSKLLLTAVMLGCAPITEGGISLEWKFTFDGSTIGMPSQSFVISQAKVAASGHAILEVRSQPNPPGVHELRYAMLDPNGKQTWVSDNMAGTTNTQLRIIHVTSDAAVLVADGDWSSPTSVTKVFTYNAKASPVFSSITLGNDERIAMFQDDSAYNSNTLVPPGSLCTPTAFYTLSGYPNHFGTMPTSFCKYKVDLASSTPTVVESFSGVDSANFVIKWHGIANVQYQIQESEDLVSWTNTGSTISGIGALMSWSTQASSPKRFYRITHQ